MVKDSSNDRQNIITNDITLSDYFMIFGILFIFLFLRRIYSMLNLLKDFYY